MLINKAVKKNSLESSGKAVLTMVLNYAFVVTFVVMFLIFTFSTEVFFSPANFVQMLTDSAPYFILCAGITFTIITGNLDLSVGSVVLAAGYISIILSNMGTPLIIVLVAPILVGTIIGFINGILITKFKMQAFIATMGMMILVRGLSLTITDGKYYYPSDSFEKFMAYKVGGTIPATIIVTILLLVFFQIVLKYSKFGRHLIAIGCNALSAAKMGIDVNKNKMFTFILSGICASVAGILTVTNVATVTPATGLGVEFTATAMVLLGGTSLFGGKGTFVPGIIFGVMFLLMIQNGLTIMGIDPYYLPIVRGICIFMAMFSDSIKIMISKR
jgi:ribose/xylose/arabinose/galactoside ABC-type transport system permease subunit